MRQLLQSFRSKFARLGIVAIFAVIGACLSGFEPQFILLLREWVWDEMVRAKPRNYDPRLKVLVVDIDEASLAEHGQWPWPRARMARLTEALREYGVRAVAFDIIFAEKDRTSLTHVFDALRRDVVGYQPPLDAGTIETQPDNDAIFADAIAKLPVVLALSVETELSPIGNRPLENLFAVKFERGRDKQNYLTRYPGAIAALPKLQSAAAGNASIDLIVDKDGITRQSPLLFKVGKRVVPSLATALVHAVNGGMITVWTRRPGFKSVSIGSLSIPTDRNGRMRLYDSGSQRSRYISAADVLSGTVPKSRLNDAVVIVGTGAEGLHDLRLTPLDQWIPGMETHAQLVEQILSSTFLDRPEWGIQAEILALLLIGILMSAAIIIGWPWMPPWGIAVFASVGFVLSTWIVYAKFNLLLDPIVPATALLTAAALDQFLLVLELRRERSAVRGAFSRYLAPAIVELLAENPSRLSLGGERRRMTYLFCDIRGFTSISERFEHDPVGLTKLINRFLTPMTDEILLRQGTIDKFMGDCIMAFWNAPLDDPEHAAHACHAALAMQGSLKKLNDNLAVTAPDTGEPFTIHVGIGINTGHCVVGNMGSEQRFDYSVLGDAVNLASRLEGQSKTYGVGILVGEETRNAAPNFATLEVDLISVKGRVGAVHVYALLGDSEVRNSYAFLELEQKQALMLSAYRDRQWELALDRIRICRSQAPAAWNLEALYDLYLDRIAAFAALPPPPDWGGIYNADLK